MVLHTGASSTAQGICQNTPPSSASISLSPTYAIEGIDDLVCSLTGSASDDDGDSVSYEFSWTVGGVPYFGATTTASSSTIPAADTSGGEEWICNVQSFDGQDYGAPVSEIATVDFDVFMSCADIYDSPSNVGDGIYSIDPDNNGSEIDVYCDMTNGGWTYEDFGMGQHNQTYTDWEVLSYTDFSSTPLAEALVYFYNLHGLTNFNTGWNSSNCCFISPGTSVPYYGFNGSLYMYPSSTGSSHDCNAGYNSSSYYFYTNSPTENLNSLTLSQAQNIGTYTSCSTNNNPAIFVKRWY